MTTIHVNINTSWDANTGNSGVDLANAITYSEWKTHILAATQNTTYLFSGSRDLGLTGPDLNNFDYGGTAGLDYDHVIDAEDSNYPWQIRGSMYFYANYAGKRIPSMKNGIVLSNISNSSFLLWGKGSCYNMYFVMKGNGSDAIQGNALDGGLLELYGCTFNDDTGVVSYDFKNLRYENCLFNMADLTASSGGGISGTVGKNSVFKQASLTGFTDTGSQTGWTHATALPISFPLTNTDLIEQTYAIDTGSGDITISAFTGGSFSGYELGIFGGQLRTSTHGIGAFYWPILLYFRTSPRSVIASSKKFIYQPVVTGDTVASWEITTMPTGMTFNTSTGRVEWTPLSGVTTSGSLTLTAHTTSTGDIAQTFTLAVDTAPRIVSTAPDVATNGSLFNYQPVVLDAENNVSGSAWSVVNSTATGLTISATTGLVSWTPNSTGVFHFTVKVVDGNGLFDAQLVTLTVS